MLGLIVAYSRNRVIGNKGEIPWKIKGEQKRFRELTTGNVVIMGRRSYEEIGKPLPGRHTIVVSRTKNFYGPDCDTVSSLKEALLLCKGRVAYIAGGAGLYEEALPLVDKMYITLVEKAIEGDTYFPMFREEKWDCEVNEKFDGEIPYTYMTYTKKQG